MISQIIHVQKQNRTGVAIAVILFVLQFVYYQMQDVILDSLLILSPGQGKETISFLPVNHLENLFKMVHILVHAAFSVIIVWFLYKDKQSTWLVVYLSVILFSSYIITNLIGKITDVFVINIISTKIYLFIASPFKTIFSIPTLKIKHNDI